MSSRSGQEFFREQAAWDEGHVAPVIEYMKIHNRDVEKALAAVHDDLYDPAAVRAWKKQYAEEIAEHGVAASDAHRWWAEEYLDRSERRLDHVGNPSITAEDATAAVAKYKEFHRFDPRKMVELHDLTIPRQMVRAGAAKWTTYRSDKVDPATLKKPRSPVSYIHEHDAGVSVYLPVGAPELTDLEIDGDPVDVPASAAGTTALVKLGTSLGFCVVPDGDEPIEVESRAPMPVLYCTPDGKCLVIVQSEREVLAMIWGGGLGVFARGIDG